MSNKKKLLPVDLLNDLERAESSKKKVIEQIRKKIDQHLVFNTGGVFSSCAPDWGSSFTYPSSSAVILTSSAGRFDPHESEGIGE